MKHVFAILFLVGLFPAAAQAGKHYCSFHQQKDVTLIVWRNISGQPICSGEYVLTKHRGKRQLKLVRSWRHGPVVYRCMAPHSVDVPAYHQIPGHVRHPWHLSHPWKAQQARYAGQFLGKHAFHTGYDGRARYLNEAWNSHYPSRLNHIWYIKQRSYLSTPSMCYVPEGYKVCLQPAFVKHGHVNVLPYLYFDSVRGVPCKTALPQFNEHVYYRQAPLEKASLAELGPRYRYVKK